MVLRWRCILIPITRALCCFTRIVPWALLLVLAACAVINGGVDLLNNGPGKRAARIHRASGYRHEPPYLNLHNFVANEATKQQRDARQQEQRESDGVQTVTGQERQQPSEELQDEHTSFRSHSQQQNCAKENSTQVTRSHTNRWRKISIAMMSVPREERYIFNTVTALKRSTTYPLHVDVYIGTHLEEEQLSFVTLHPWDQPRGKYATKTLHARGNYGRILDAFARSVQTSFKLGEDSPSGVLILEDDLEIGDHSIERLIETIDRIEAHNVSHYVLDCYVTMYSLLEPSGIDHVFRRRGETTCSQCLYFPRSIVSGLASYLLDPRRMRKNVPYDLALGWHLARHTPPYPWLAMDRAIVDHVGTASTGLASKAGFHKSLNYSP